MAYRARTPPSTKYTARYRMGYGFQLAPGANYSVGDEPTIAQRLNRLAQALKLHLTGLSGYRSPAHSVAVGGFPNDPHTRGQASDTPGIEKVPESTLERFGLTRPFSGAKEADHIQLLGGSRRTPGTTTDGPAQWLKQAGWPNRLIPIMVAIGGAESHWTVDATSPKNSNGTVDYGWLQVNSVHGFNPARLTSDPVYNARAALTVYRQQGLGAWSTYKSGAYRTYMGQAPSGGFGRTRPGGDSPTGPTPDTELAAFWDNGLPGTTPAPFNLLPNPLDLFKGAGKAVNSVNDFMKWIAWIFHPLNILRISEFLAGFPLILFGVWIMVKEWQGASRETPMRTARRIAARTPTPVGRGMKVVNRVDPT